MLLGWPTFNFWLKACPTLNSRYLQQYVTVTMDQGLYLSSLFGLVGPARDSSSIQLEWPFESKAIKK